MSIAISIVIPTYNPGPKIVDAVESCFNQTFQDFEILLVNNHPSGSTLDILAPYLNGHPNKFRIIDEPRQGVCSARNRGICEAKGLYIALLDHDDIMYPNRLKAQLAASEEHPEAALIHGLFDRVTPDNRYVLKKDNHSTPEFWRSLLFAPNSTLAQAPTVPPSVMFFKKETAIRAKLFDEGFNPQWVEDSEFCLKMSEQGPFVHVNEALVRWRFHPEDYVTAREKSDLYIKLRNQDRLYRILFHKYGSKKTQSAFRKIRGRWLREASFPLLPYRENRHMACTLIRRSLHENPLDPKTWKVWVRTCYPMSLWPSIFNFDEWVDERLPPHLDESFVRTVFQSTPLPPE